MSRLCVHGPRRAHILFGDEECRGLPTDPPPFAPAPPATPLQWKRSLMATIALLLSLASALPVLRGDTLDIVGVFGCAFWIGVGTGLLASPK